MSDPYDISSTTDRASGLSRFVDPATGNTWTQPDPVAVPLPTRPGGHSVGLGMAREIREASPTVMVRAGDMEPEVYRIPETGLHGAFRDVAAFMRAVGQEILDHPAVPDRATQSLRLKLVEEEISELHHAWPHNLPALCDAIIDAIYVLIGMGLAYGIDLPAAWVAVQEANMKKVGGPKCPETGKALKPEGWQPPDIGAVLRRQRPLSESYPPIP